MAEVINLSAYRRQRMPAPTITDEEIRQAIADVQRRTGQVFVNTIGPQHTDAQRQSFLNFLAQVQ